MTDRTLWTESQRNMVAPISRYRSRLFIKVFKRPNTLTYTFLRIGISDSLWHGKQVCEYFEIKKEKGNEADLSYSVIVAAVCQVTNMTRRHGNIKQECYKITVALKKTITKHGYICDMDLKSCQACNPALRNCAMQNRPIAATNAGITCRMDFSFSFYRLQSGTFISFLFLKLVKIDTAALLFSIFFFFHASYYDTAALLFSLFLNFLLFYVYSLYFRYNLLLWYYLLVQ